MKRGGGGRIFSRPFNSIIYAKELPRVDRAWNPVGGEKIKTLVT